MASQNKKSSSDEELWKIDNVMEAMWNTHYILDSHYKKFGLHKVASKGKYLPEEERVVIPDLISKY